MLEKERDRNIIAISARYEFFCDYFDFGKGFALSNHQRVLTSFLLKRNQPVLPGWFFFMNPFKFWALISLLLVNNPVF